MYRPYKRGRTWYCDYIIGDFRTRKSLQVTNKEEADKVAKKIHSELVNSNFGILDKKNINFSKLCEEFLLFSKNNHATSTHNDYRRVIKNNLIPYFKKMPLSFINSESVEKFKQHWLKKNHPVSVNKFLRYLKSVFGKAVYWKHIKENPVSGIKMLPQPDKRYRYLEMWEIERVLANAGRLKLFLITALHTGMRKSELENLQWKDVDFNNKQIIVCNTKEFHTKNYKNRTIPMTPDLYSALFEEYQNKISKYVFKDCNGRMQFTIKGALKKICELSDVAPFCLHDLRRTYASHLAQSSANLPTIQMLLGHKDISTTMKYINISYSRLTEAVSMLPYGKTESDGTIMAQTK